MRSLHSFMEYCIFHPIKFRNLNFDNRHFKNAFAQLFVLKFDFLIMGYGYSTGIDLVLKYMEFRNMKILLWK